MLIPIRCFSCGSLIGDKWEEYNRRVNVEKENPEKVLNDLGVKNYCCRRMLISHVDLIDEVLVFHTHHKVR